MAATGNATYDAFQAADTLQFNGTRRGVCDPSQRTPPPEAVAIDGSGLLLPFYLGVVQALQERGVLTPDVIAQAQFGGVSGGSITATLTGTRAFFVLGLDFGPNFYVIFLI